MGLDMYAFKVKGLDLRERRIDFNSAIYDADGARRDGVMQEELHYWRKHPDLHGWMFQRYVEKGGSNDPEAFNCKPMLLTAADLDDLEADINERRLPRTEGFFFGQSYGNRQERTHDLCFVAKAREALAEGWTVYYDSWW